MQHKIVTEKRTVVVDTCDETKGIETEEHENKQYYAKYRKQRY